MKERYVGLDLLRLILAFFVVCIHIPFGDSEMYPIKIYRIICRTGVPIFFMITGHFYIDSIKNNKQIKHIKKIVILYITSIFIYFLRARIKSMFTLKGNVFIKIIKLIKLIFLENIQRILFASPDHLWYLHALICVLLIFYIITAFTDLKKFRILIPILLIGNLLLGKYNILCFAAKNFVFPRADTLLFYLRSYHAISRNFLFIGIPFVLTGYQIRMNTDKINKIKHPFCVMTVIFLLNAAEYCLLSAVGKKYSLPLGDLYIFTPFLSVMIFILFLKIRTDNKIIVFLSNMGRKYSVYIYVFHIMIWEIFEKLLKYFPTVFRFYKPVAPVIIFIMSTIAAVIIYNCLEKIKKSKKYEKST